MARQDPSAGYGLSVIYQLDNVYRLTFGYSAFDVFKGTRYGKLDRPLPIPPTLLYTYDTFVALKYRRDDWLATVEYHRLEGTTTLPLRDQGKGDNHGTLIFTVTKMF